MENRADSAGGNYFLGWFSRMMGLRAEFEFLLSGKINRWYWLVGLSLSIYLFKVRNK